jgi:hypothetical protein
MVRVEDSVVMNFKVDGLGFRRFKEVVGQYQRWFVYETLSVFKALLSFLKLRQHCNHLAT